jgi:Tfp pilus assembly protein PilN
MAAAAPAEGAPPWGIFATILLITVLATLGYGAWLMMENHNLAQQIARQREELKKYEGAREKVKELEQKKKEYSAKVDQIKELKDKQSLPVKLMNRLVEVLPEGAWYTSAKQSSNGIILQGRARSIKTISSLYDNMVDMKEFSSVQLGDVRQESGQGEQVYSYKLSANYKPEPDQPQPGQAAQPAKTTGNSGN